MVKAGCIHSTVQSNLNGGGGGKDPLWFIPRARPQFFFLTRSIPYHDTLITTVLHALEAAEKDRARSALAPLLLAGDSQHCHPLPALRHGGMHPLEALLHRGNSRQALTG